MYDLLYALLTPLVAFLLQLVFKAIGFEIDPVMFNTLVAAIVVYFLTLFGVPKVAGAIRAVRARFK